MTSRLAMFLMLTLLVWCSILATLVQADNHDAMSHSEVRSVRVFKSAAAAAAHAHAHSQQASGRFHQLADSSSISSSLVVLVPALTVGPYFEALTDFVDSSDLLAAAKAGSAGVTTDRVSVLNGVPLALTLNIYNVSGSLAYPLEGATVYIWHCDAYGVYSAVATGSGNPENTVGQKWLRGYQATSASGTVTFNTIIPGWYTGRTVHYHLRVHLAGAASNQTFVITTQLFPSTAVVSAVSAVSPYTSDTQTYTALTSDSIYSSVSSTLASELILNTTGSTSGYAATFNLGIDSSSTSSSSSSSSTTTSAPSGTGSSTKSSGNSVKMSANAHTLLSALFSAAIVFLQSKLI